MLRNMRFSSSTRANVAKQAEQHCPAELVRGQAVRHVLVSPLLLLSLLRLPVLQLVLLLLRRLAARFTHRSSSS